MLAALLSSLAVLDAQGEFFSAGLAIGLGVCSLSPVPRTVLLHTCSIGGRRTAELDPHIAQPEEPGGYVAGGPSSSILITIAADPSIMVFLTGRMGTTIWGRHVWG